LFVLQRQSSETEGDQGTSFRSSGETGRTQREGDE